MNTDELLAAGDPYPERSVEGLALDAESHALMEEIMSTPTSASPGKEPPVRRRPRWLVPAGAAAAVAAVVAGAVFWIDPQSEPGSPTGGGVAAPTDQNTGKPQEDVPPPTADNLHYVVLTAAGWNVTDVYDDEGGGYVAWSDGENTIEMTWYPADEHRTYIRDRTQDDDYQKTRASLLGQKGWTFRTRYTDNGGTQWWTDESAPPAAGNKGDAGQKQSGKKVLRVETMLPPVGKWFLGFNVEVPNQAAYRELIASLQRVDRRTWLDSLDGGVVRPGEADAFLDEAGRDVPMPPGVTVTPKDLRLPQDPYQARVAFAQPVLCGWFEEYANGDDGALDVLREAEDWPVLRAMVDDGEYAQSVPEEVRILERHPKYKGWRQVLGC